MLDNKIICKNSNKIKFKLSNKNKQYFEKLGIKMNELDFDKIIKNYLNYLKENE